MNLASLKNLIYHKANVSPDDDDQVAIVATVIAEVLDDVSRRFPWSFLKKQSTSITFSAGDYQKELPADFLQLIHFELKDSGNKLHPVHSVNQRIFGEELPNLGATGGPYRFWYYYDGSRKPYIECRPKLDGDYTANIWYKEKLSTSSMSVIPNGLVVAYGCLAMLAPTDEMDAYDGRFERGILKMWANDMPDLSAEIRMGVDQRIEAYNRFTAGI